MTQKQTKARRALLDSAMVLLADNPGASFMEIAEVAGIGRATLYRHFPTREDLIRALTMEAIEATDEAAAKIMTHVTNSRDALRALLKAMIEVGDRCYFLTRLPEAVDEEINSHIRRQERELQELIRWAQSEGVIDNNVPTVWASSVLNSLIYAAWEMRNNDSGLDKDQLTELGMRTLERGLGGAA